MLAAEVAEHVVARRLLAASRDEAQHQGRHQGIVERADRAIGGQLRGSRHQPSCPSTMIAFDLPALSRMSSTGL